MMMKNTRVCPKCAGEGILKVSEVADKAPGEDGGVLSIFARISEEGLGEWESLGVFEAYVCERCGYTEWFVQDPGSLPVDGAIVQRLEPEKNKGPYR